MGLVAKICFLFTSLYQDAGASMYCMVLEEYVVMREGKRVFCMESLCSKAT